MMKHDKYFASIRQFILEKYNIESKVRKDEKQPKEMLKKITSHPMNYYRALESEKEKKQFLQFVRKDINVSLHDK